MFRLKELRLENGMTRSSLARALELPATTVANYENETRQAPYELLIRLADFFRVSVDYLLGRTDDFGLSAGEKANPALLTQSERRLLAVFRSCSSLGQERISEYAALWQEAERGEKS